jgi:hypothetical protein
MRMGGTLSGRRWGDNEKTDPSKRLNDWIEDHASCKRVVGLIAQTAMQIRINGWDNRCNSFSACAHFRVMGSGTDRVKDSLDPEQQKQPRRDATVNEQQISGLACGRSAAQERLI